MMPPQRPSVGVIGAGKVGCTLARLLYAAGYTVAAVYSPTPAHSSDLARQVGAEVADDPPAVAATCDLTLVAVPDDALVAAGNALLPGARPGRAVVHTSGALDASVFAGLAALGVRVGSLHPAFPFADVETAVRRLKGATFAVEADDADLGDWLTAVVAALDGQVLRVPPGKKPLYHAALVLAGNYTVTLYALAARLLAGIGAEPSAISGALNTGLAAVLENLQVTGIPAALTGPLVRGDVGTVEAHLRALAQVDAPIAEVYRELAWLSLPMVIARGVDTAALERLLAQEE